LWLLEVTKFLQSQTYVDLEILVNLKLSPKNQVPEEALCSKAFSFLFWLLIEVSMISFVTLHKSIGNSGPIS
jgi:hypothetical protein